MKICTKIGCAYALISRCHHFSLKRVFPHASFFEMVKVTAKKQERQSYTIQEKLHVVRFALSSSNIKAAVKFSLNKSQVGRWVNQLKNQLDVVRNNKLRRLGGGRKEFFPEEEAQLYAWVIEMRSAALAVTYSGLKFKMLEIVSETAASIDDPMKKQIACTFKASSTWLTRFLKRYNLTLRRKTKIAQKMPADLEQKLLDFQHFVIRLRRRKNFPLSHIANMDETPVWFDMAGDLTVENIGAKTVHVRTTGNEKNRFTVVLTCFADGQKLPPMVIFKGKRWPTTKKTPPPPSGVIIAFHEKGWMDESGMLVWAESYAKDRPGSQQKEPALLVFDSFKGHLTDTVKEEIKKHNTDLVVIPGGLTSICQPLDVSINRPFKVALRRHWHAWMASGNVEKTKQGNLKRAELRTVCEWVLAAWAEIDPEIIRRAFLKCSISNAMDGSEDNAIYDDEIYNSGENDKNEDQVNEENVESEENEKSENDESSIDDNMIIDEVEDVVCLLNNKNRFFNN